MGGPANYDNLLKALKTSNAPLGGNRRPQDHSSSTAVSRRKFASSAANAANFVWRFSLHGATDETATKSSFNRKYPRAETHSSL